MEKEYQIFKNGSAWLRTDFHLHTKADKEFTYEGDNNKFISEYIYKLKEQGVSVGIITNHNKFDLEEFKALRKAALKEEIFLLPGVELSVNDGKSGIHLLISFKYESWITDTTDFINQFLNVLFEGIANRENENTPCKYGLDTIFQKLDEYRTDGRDSFSIMAHIEDNKGLFHDDDGLGGSRKTALASNESFYSNVLGFQQVRTQKLISNLQNLFNNRLPTFVEGSDCKNLDSVGKPKMQNGVEKKTFIKIGDFNFEAVKIALIDRISRTNDNEKPTRNSWIKSIVIEGGLLDRKKIDLSPELNSLIGIRGSGKSSIIEILRYTLNIPLGNKAIDKDYKNGLIEHVLKSGGRVKVTIMNEHNEEYVVNKIYGQKEDIYKNDIRQDISIDAIFKRPLYFGQKDLSNKDIDFESDLINKLVGSRLEAIKSKVNGKRNEIKNLISNLDSLGNLKDLKNETESKIKSAEHQLKIFKEKGIEEKLKQQSYFDSDITKLADVEKNLFNILNVLREIVKENSSFFKQEIKSSNINEDIFKEGKEILKEIEIEFKKLTEIGVSIQNNSKKFSLLLTKLNERKEDLKEEFAKIKREINIPSLNPDDFLKLNRLIETSLLKLKEIEKSEQKRKDLLKAVDDKLTEINDLWLEEYRILVNEIERVNKTSNQISISIEFKGRRDKLLNELKQTFKGSGIRDNTYQEIVDDFKDFIEIYRNPEKIKNLLNENHQLQFMEKFKDNRADLLTYQVENKYEIKYKNKPLKDHSLGQRASALILFLLAQKDNDILIIDQPEDDLDNQTIYEEVIKELKGLKGDMQFIFATHNANIPVLGDSEMVISCQYFDNHIKLNLGSIDKSSTQKEVVGIMEGGKEAFTRRKEIYSIWSVEK